MFISRGSTSILVLLMTGCLEACAVDHDHGLTQATSIVEAPSVRHFAGEYGKSSEVAKVGLPTDPREQRLVAARSIGSIRRVLGTPTAASESSILNIGTGSLNGVLAKDLAELVARNQQLPVTVESSVRRNSDGRRITADRYRVNGRLVMEVGRARAVSGLDRPRSRGETSALRVTDLRTQPRDPWVQVSMSQHEQSPVFFLEASLEDPYLETPAAAPERAAIVAGLVAMQSDLDEQIVALSQLDPSFMVTSATADSAMGACQTLAQLSAYRVVVNMGCNSYASRLVAISASLGAIATIGGAIALTVAPEPVSKFGVALAWTAASAAVIGAAAAIIQHNDCMKDPTHSSIGQPRRNFSQVLARFPQYIAPQYIRSL